MYTLIIDMVVEADETAPTLEQYYTCTTYIDIKYRGEYETFIQHRYIDLIRINPVEAKFM